MQNSTDNRTKESNSYPADLESTAIGVSLIPEIYRLIYANPYRLTRADCKPYL